MSRTRTTSRTGSDALPARQSGGGKRSMKFEAMYRTLNAAQKEAVDAIEGPVMVIAGPGTGKTHILTLRIANILQKTDTPPDGILALTFTEAGAANMRRRLAETIGPSGYRVRIHTFHGFCQDVIERYPDDFPRIIGAEPITDIEKVGVLESIIMEPPSGSWKHLKPFGDNLYYLNPIRSAIAEMKRENVSADRFAEFLARERSSFDAISDLHYESGAYAGMMKGKYSKHAKVLERSEELLIAYRAYEAALVERRRYDFEDMIMEVVSRLEEDNDLLLRLQEESLYILADEHQDANAAQNRLLELLSSFHDSPNLFVVGDEKQAIFRFQGASLENFGSFKRLYPNARVIALSDSYRSGQAILDAAHALAAARTEGDMPPSALMSKAGIETSAIEVRAFSSPNHERSWIAHDAARLVAEGVDPSSIALLYRTNGEAADLAATLAALGLPVSIESDQDVLGDPDLRRLLTLLRAVAYLGEDDALAAALHLNFLKISPLDAYKIGRHAKRNNLLLADVIGRERELRKAGVDNVKRVSAFSKDIERWAELPGAVSEHVDTIMRESGFVRYALNSGRAVELLEKLGGLLRDVETLSAADHDYTLSKLCDDIGTLETHRIPVRKERHALKHGGALHLMTAHRSKGLEFEYVYVSNVLDGVWGGRRESSLFLLPGGAAQGSDEDERRLLYVALTRAKRGVAVSYSLKSGSGTDKLPSRLLSDIHPSLVTNIDTEAFEADDKPIAARSARARAGVRDASYLRGLFQEQGLSVTALNNYLACPWRYFYSSLIRIPKSPTKEMLFGTAAHAALRRFFESNARGKDLKLADLSAQFEDALTRLPLSRGEREEVRARGVRFLAGWYGAFEGRWVLDSKSEYKIETHMDVQNIPFPLPLHGVLDRIEFKENGVNVVDYKTGKPITRNAILGKTRDEKGPAYFRQLVFYKMLLDREGKYPFKTAELNFLQPDDRGTYHTEIFEVSEEDVDTLRSEIAKAAKEIYALSFWNKRCDNDECEYCDLRDLMRS